MARKSRSPAKLVKAKEFGLALQRLEKKTNKAMLNHVVKSAYELAEQARKFAPLRTGALTNSIMVEETRDFGGRTEFEVTVDEETMLGNIDHPQSYPFAYHQVHEDGENSKVKFTYAKKPRGAHYMERAARKLRKNYLKTAEVIANKYQLQF